MHQITKKALSPDAQIENCVRGILDDFNQDPENFKATISTPWQPCKYEVGLIKVKSVAISLADQGVLVANIKDRFKCLYYSFRNKVLGESREVMAEEPNKLLEVGDGIICGSTCDFLTTPDNWPPCNLLTSQCGGVWNFGLWQLCNQRSSQCGICIRWRFDFPNEPLFETVNEDKTQGGVASDFFFDYKYPSELPSPVDRFRKGWLFDYDFHLSLDTTAEDMIIAVFDEFSGCAVSAKFLLIMRMGE